VQHNGVDDTERLKPNRKSMVNLHETIADLSDKRAVYRGRSQSERARELNHGGGDFEQLEAEVAAEVQAEIRSISNPSSPAIRGLEARSKRPPPRRASLPVAPVARTQVGSAPETSKEGNEHTRRASIDTYSSEQERGSAAIHTRNVALGVSASSVQGHADKGRRSAAAGTRRELNRADRLKEIYCEFDIDGGGEVGEEEIFALGTARRKLIAWTDKQTHSMMKNMGCDKENNITSSNFVTYFKQKFSGDSDGVFSKTMDQFLECARLFRERKIADRNESTSAKPGRSVLQPRLEVKEAEAGNEWDVDEMEEGDEECAWVTGSPTGRQGSDLMAAKSARQSPNRLGSDSYLIPPKEFDSNTLPSKGNNVAESPLVAEKTISREAIASMYTDVYDIFSTSEIHESEFNKIEMLDDECDWTPGSPTGIEPLDERSVQPSKPRNGALWNARTKWRRGESSDDTTRPVEGGNVSDMVLRTMGMGENGGDADGVRQTSDLLDRFVGALTYGDSVSSRGLNSTTDHGTRTHETIQDEIQDEIQEENTEPTMHSAWSTADNSADAAHDMDVEDDSDDADNTEDVNVTDADNTEDVNVTDAESYFRFKAQLELTQMRSKVGLEADISLDDSHSLELDHSDIKFNRWATRREDESISGFVDILRSISRSRSRSSTPGSSSSPTNGHLSDSYDERKYPSPTARAEGRQAGWRIDSERSTPGGDSRGTPGRRGIGTEGVPYSIYASAYAVPDTSSSSTSPSPEAQVQLGSNPISTAPCRETAISRAAKRAIDAKMARRS